MAKNNAKYNTQFHPVALFQNGPIILNFVCGWLIVSFHTRLIQDWLFLPHRGVTTRRFSCSTLQWSRLVYPTESVAAHSDSARAQPSLNCKLQIPPHVPCDNAIERIWDEMDNTVNALLWRHNERDSVSNHQRLYCLLNRLFRRRSKITSKLRVTGLCAGNSPVAGEFPPQRASNAENVSIWWRHHEDVWCLAEYAINSHGKQHLRFRDLN